MTLEELARKTQKKVVFDREDELIPSLYNCLSEFDTWKDIVEFQIDGDLGLTLESPVEDFVEVLISHTSAVNEEYKEQFNALPPETKDENGRPIEGKIMIAHQVAVIQRFKSLPEAFRRTFGDYFTFRELVVSYLNDENKPDINIETPEREFVQYFVNEVNEAAEHFSFVEELMEAGAAIIKFEDKE